MTIFSVIVTCTRHVTSVLTFVGLGKSWRFSFVNTETENLLNSSTLSSTDSDCRICLDEFSNRPAETKVSVAFDFNVRVNVKCISH